MNGRLVQPFQAAAAAHPHTPAVIFWTDDKQKQEVTYGELQSQAQAIARLIREKVWSHSSLPTCSDQTERARKEPLAPHSQFQPDTQENQSRVENSQEKLLVNDVGEGGKFPTKVIGILCTGLEVVPCVLGILQVNHAYLYLSPDLTVNELTELISKVKPEVLLIEEKYIERFNNMFTGITCCFQVFDKKFKLFHNRTDNVLNTKCVDFENLAYAISTSGSTGVPKTVFVPHSCIIPNINDFLSLFDIRKDDVVFNAAPFTFDPSVVDLFMALHSGGTLVVVAPQVLRIPSQLLEVLIRSRVTILQATPTLLMSLGKVRLREYILCSSSSLRILALGGEMFPKISVLRDCMGEGCKTRIFNLYGITEVSCWSTVEEVALNSLSAQHLSLNSKREIWATESNEKFTATTDHFLDDWTPIGVPLSFTMVRVVNRQGEEVVDGEEGEIFLGGERKCFVDGDTGNWSSGIQENYTRATGDRGIIRGGKIYCLGRLDQQVKRNGQKVSLLEIKRLCMRLCYVIACYVLLHGQNRIIAFVHTAHECSTNAAEIWKVLKTNLSLWKLPDDILVIHDVKFNKHGKVDTCDLLARYDQFFSQNNLKYKSESLEAYLTHLWTQTLRCKVKPDENFIKSGGNSLKAVLFVEKMERFLEKIIPGLLDVLLSSSFETTLQFVAKCCASSQRAVADVSLVRSTSKKMKSDMLSRVNNTGMQLSPGMFDLPVDSTLCSDSLAYVQKRLNLDINVVSRRHYFNGESFYSSEHLPTKLTQLWNYNLGKCIDSSPLLVQFSNGDILVFVGSHSHKFACVDGVMGKERWCLVLGGRIESSPAVSSEGSLVYVGCYDGCLYCVNVEQGAVRWKFQTEGEVKSSPCVDGETGNVLFGSHDKTLYCVDNDGMLNWLVKMSNGSIFSSPLIVEGLVFIATLDGFVGAVDKVTGMVKWKVNVNNPVFSSPSAFSRGIIFCTVQGDVLAYSLSGSPLWKYCVRGNIFSTPHLTQFSQGREIFGIGCHDHSAYFFSVDGQLLAKYSCCSPVFTTPYILPFSGKDNNEALSVICETGGKLSVVHMKLEVIKDGKLQKLMLKLNLMVDWNFNGELFASPIISGDRLYVGCRDDFLYCMQLHQK